MTPYSKYRDSGSEWLGEVPAHWEVIRLKKHLAANTSGVWGNDPNDLTDTPVLRSTDQTVSGEWRLNEPAMRELTGEDAERYRLHEGDLLVTKSSGSELHIGKTTIVGPAVAELNACYSNFMQRLTVDGNTHPKLVWYWLNNRLAREQFALLSNSTTGLANLNGTIIEELRLTLPPLPEQRAIAAYLDRETGRIDQAVAEQRRLIELLAEKRQATISHAVTKGLDPTAPLRPSGIDWLGDVPKHWDVVRLRFLATIETGSADTQDADEDGAYPFFVRSDTVERIGHATHDCEAVLTSGDGAGVGKIYHWFAGEFTAHQRVYIFRDFERCSGEWFFRYMQALFEKVALDGGAKSTVDSLRRPMLSNFPVAFPSKAEQALILLQVAADLDRFHTLTTTANSAITLLLERRAALVSAAVTGKIDVRGLVDADEMEAA